jgi:hypothetical protein
MKYAVEMRSGAVIFTQRFIKIGPSVQKFMGDTQTHSMETA